MKQVAGLNIGWQVLLGMSLMGLLGVSARAEENPGITVLGKGVVEAMPDTVELTALVEGNAELAGDAVAKYRGSKKRVVEALGALNLKGMSIAGSGLAVNSGTTINPIAAIQAGAANQPKPVDKVAVQERLTIALSGVNAMSADDLLQAVTRIIDVLKDAGVPMSQAPKSMIELQFTGAKPATLATFRLTNADSLRQQAYESALKQARSKAERLAKLAMVDLGEIVSIEETAAAKDDNKSNVTAYIAMLGAQSSSQSEDTAGSLQNIPVTVNLTVQFAIVKKK